MGEFNKSDENGNHSTGDFMKIGSKERVILTVDYHFQKHGSKSSRNCGSEERIWDSWSVGGLLTQYLFFKIITPEAAPVAREGAQQLALWQGPEFGRAVL